jgi:hypothetical protein
MSAAVTQPRCSIDCCTIVFSSSALSQTAPVRERGVSEQQLEILVERADGTVEIVDERAREQVPPQALECGAKERVRKREGAPGIRFAAAARATHDGDDRHQ